MNKPQHQCPKCDQHFTKVVNDNHRKFCPHCDIQLFIANSNIQNKKNSLKKETGLSITKSGFFAFIALTLLAVSVETGLYDYCQNNQNFVSLIFLLFIIILISWDALKDYKKRPTEEIPFKSGVDTLADYREDYCDYKIIRERLCQHQCPHCQSYRMVNLFWFKRKIKKLVNNDNIHEDSFVGCLKCETTYTTETKRTKFYNYWLWSSLFIFIFFLVGSYQALTYFFEFSERLKDGLVYFNIFWGLGFISYQKELHVKDPFKTDYNIINVSSIK